VRIRVGIRIRIRIAVVCGRNDGWFFNCHFNFRVATRRLPMLGQPSTSHSPSTWRKGGPGPTPFSGPFPVQELAAAMPYRSLLAEVVMSTLKKNVCTENGLICKRYNY